MLMPPFVRPKFRIPGTAVMAAIAIIAAATTLSIHSPVQAQSKTIKEAKAGDPVVARIDKSEIRLSHVKAIHASLALQYRSVSFEQLYPQLLKRVVERHLLTQAARLADLTKDPEVMANIRRAEDRVLGDAWISKVIKKEVSEDKVMARYEQKMGPGGSDEVRARHILLKDEAAALIVLKKIRQGADFTEMARQHSTGPSGAKGGDLGYFNKKQMVPAFSQAAFALQPGDVSQPVKTQFGWHLIKVVDRRKAKAPELAQETQQIRKVMIEEVMAAELLRLRQAAKIETFGIDGRPMPGSAAKK